ncbi:isoleucine--tRNA ligase [Candidatus Parcubacteria bacterium]|nr:MAG: isoleucine--tRNA ligase [Candidatus Parcubacteria bacterium]
MEKSAIARQEEEILKFWQDNKIFEKTLEKDSPKGNFVFFEGPPTANAAPGVHHVLARAFKDLIPRYKTMQGYRVLRKAGWDTHGLPVELQVEKKLGLKSKLEIESIVPDDPKESIKKFNTECKKTVWQFKEDWEKLTSRIAYWEDMENPYITYENNYIESVWQVIKKAGDRGLLYIGHKVVPFCTRCGTALSSHEVAQGYDNIEEDSVYIKCKVIEGNKFVKAGDFILTWTTTPWTLPGNVALAVGEDIDYLRMEIRRDKKSAGKFSKEGIYIFARDTLKNVVSSNARKEDLDSILNGSEVSISDNEVEGNFVKNTYVYKILAVLKGKDLTGATYQPLFPGSVDGKNFDQSWTIVSADFVTTTDGTGVVHTAVMYGEDDYTLGDKIGLPKQHTVGLDGKFLPQVKGLAGLYVKDEKTTELIYDHLKKTGAFYKTEKYRHDYPFCWRCNTPLLYYAKDSWFIKMSELKPDLLKNASEINWVPGHIKEGRFGEWLSGIKDWAISRERYWGTPLPIWQCEKCKKIKVIGSSKELPKKLDDLHRPFIDEIVLDCQCGEKMSRVPEVLDVWFDSGSMPFAQYHYPFENKNLIDNKEQFPADYISEAIDQTRGWFYTLLAVSTIMDKGTSYKNVICLGHINDAKGHKMSKSKGNVINPWDVIESYGADSLRWYLYTMNQPGETKNFDMAGVKESMQKVIMLLGNVISFYKLYAKDEIAAVKAESILDKWVLAKLDDLVFYVTKELELYHITESGRAIQDFINELSTWYVRRSRNRFKDGDKKAVAVLGYVLLELVKLMAPFMPFAAERFYKDLQGKKESVHLESWPKPGKQKAESNKLLEQMAQARRIVEAGLAARAKAGVKVRQVLQSYCTDIVKKLEPELAAIVCEELNIKELKFNKEHLDTEITPELELEGQAREFIRNINLLRKEAGLTINDKIDLIFEGDIDELLENYEAEIKKATLTEQIKKGKMEKPKTVKINDVEVQIEIKRIN